MRLLGLNDQEIIKRLQREAKNRKNAWKRAHAFFDLFDQFYYFERYGKKAPGSSSGKDGVEVQVNDGTNVIDLAIGLLGGTEIDIHAVSIETDAESTRDTSEVEAWLWGVLDANAQDQGEEPHEAALFDALRLGMGVLQIYYDGDRDCPFVVKPLDPYTVYPEEGGPKGKWRSILVIEKKPVTQLEEEWGTRIPEKSNAPYEDRERLKLDEVDYWGYEYVDEELAAKLSEEMGLGEEMDGEGMPPEGGPEIPALPYGEEEFSSYGKQVPMMEGRSPEEGRLPQGEQMPFSEQQGIEPGWYIVNCVLAVGGGKRGHHILRMPTIVDGYEELPFTFVGCKPGGGRARGERRPEYYFLSALFPIHKAIPLSDLNMSAKQKQVALYTNLPILHSLPRSGKGASLQWDQKLGNLVGIRKAEGEDISFPQWPGNPPDVFAMDAFYKKQIQEGSFSSVAMGEQVQLSGFAMSQLWQANLVRLSQPRKSLARALKDVFRKIQGYATQLAGEEPIQFLCRYKKILGKMIEMTGQELEGFIIDVELSTDLPQDKYRRMAIGMQMAQLGPQSPFSQRTLGERFFDIQQMEEEERQKIDEAMRNNAIIKAMAIQDAVEAESGEKIPLEFLIQGGPEVAQLAQMIGVSGQAASQQEMGREQQQPQRPQGGM